MQRLIPLLMVCSVLAIGRPHSQRVNSSTTNIPAAFSADSGSKMANLTAIGNPQTLCVENRSATEVAVNCSTVGSILPTDTTQNLYINASSAACWDNAFIKGDCYLRSMGSAISSGVVVVTVISKD